MRAPVTVHRWRDRGSQVSKTEHPLMSCACCIARSIAPFQASGGVARWANDAWGRLLYRYYNWRQDTGSDLLLIVVANVLLVICGAVFKDVVVDPAEGLPRGFWANIYDVRLALRSLLALLRRFDASRLPCPMCIML